MDNKNMLSDEELENVNGGMYGSGDIITRGDFLTDMICS